MKLRIPRSVGSFIVCTMALLLLYLTCVAAYTQIALIIRDLPTYSERVRVLAERLPVNWNRRKTRPPTCSLPNELKSPPSPTSASAAGRDATAAAPIGRSPPCSARPAEIPEVRIRDERRPMAEYLYDNLSAFYYVFLMASFVPFLVYFMLSWKEHMRRSYLHLFEGQDRQAAARSWEGIADMARAYVLGNFVLGILFPYLARSFSGRSSCPTFR